MTLLLMESWDIYNSTTDAQNRQWIWAGGTGNGESLNTSTVRTGTKSLSIGTNSGQYCSKQLASTDEHATLAAGTGLYMSDLTGSRAIMSFRSDTRATYHVLLAVNANGGFDVYRGNFSTLLGSTANGLITAGTWHYIEMKALLSDTVGTVQLWLDGYSKLSLTSQDTKNAGTKTVFDSFSLGPSNTSGSLAMLFDDVYLCNGAGSVNNDRLGEMRIRVLNPNGDGNYSQFTGSDGNSTNNSLLVDDLVNDSTAQTDYVESSTTDQIDTYAFSNLTETTGAVAGVNIITNAQKTDAGARSLALVTRVSSTDYASSDISLATSFAFQQQLQEVNPNTSAAWAISEVNGAEFGVKCRP